MIPLSRFGIFCGVAAVFALFTAPARAQVTVSTGADYSEGRYGESQKTDLLSIPANIEYSVDQWTFKVSVPYLHMTGPGDVIPGIGRVKKSRTPSRRTVTGVGDTTLDGTYVIYQPSDASWTVDVGGELKLGTASSARGLGTGRTDYDGHFDVYRTVGKMTGILTAGYRILGSPAGDDLKNYAFGTIGFSYQATSADALGLLYSGNQRTSPTSGPQGELMGFVTRKFNEHWTAQTYVMLGVNSASPDIGVGVLVSHIF